MISVARSYLCHPKWVPAFAGKERRCGATSGGFRRNAARSNRSRPPGRPWGGWFNPDPKCRIVQADGAYNRSGPLFLMTVETSSLLPSLFQHRSSLLSGRLFPVPRKFLPVIE